MLGTLIDQLETLQAATADDPERFQSLNREISNLAAQNLVLTRLYNKKLLPTEDYYAQSGKRGSVDLILTKSISRFARNTVDCLKYVRLLRDLNVDVYFEEQGIHSNQPGAEFYITIYGCIAQSESENISANVRWGKEQSAKQGKVIFQYQSLLGYRRGADGQPEIDEKEAETVRLIYRRYLMGDSLRGIADRLERQGGAVTERKTDMGHQHHPFHPLK